MQNIVHDYASFNAPSWSVSVEILIYFLFFLCCVAGLMKGLRNLLITLSAVILARQFNLLFAVPQLTQCLYFFMFGCLLSWVIAQKKWKMEVTLYSSLLSLWLLPHVIPADWLPYWVGNTDKLNISVLVKSLLIIAAFIHAFNRPVFRSLNNSYFKSLGDMTYSMYLLHFPLQVILVLLIDPTQHALFFSPWFFVFYISLVLVLAGISFRKFERPIQNFIRHRYLKFAQHPQK